MAAPLRRARYQKVIMDQVKDLQNIDIKENAIWRIDNALLNILLKDKSSGGNLIWATDTYASRGYGFQPQDQITVNLITGRLGNIVKPRITKSKKEQKDRIKKKAEVFTPSWICNMMANGFDEWFERGNVFNVPDGVTWHKTEGKITFPEGKTWRQYIRLRILEITCGEAPFLASRYDTVTGEWIDVNSRVGLLDRKLRVINENVTEEKEWVKYAEEAYQSTYGFEWQGDSLLIARENLLYTFIDFFTDKFGNFPKIEYLLSIANILAWNVFQMDGLKYVVPYSCNPIKSGQLSMFDIIEEFDCLGCQSGNNSKHMGIYPIIKNWRSKINYRFYDLLGGKKMKFDYIIGNPPYQEKSRGANANDTPVYHWFYDGAMKVSDRIELITPARFLFNAGGTPQEWNRQMLDDEHFKVVLYEPNSRNVFNNADIKGGVAVTYYDRNKTFGAIGVFSAYPELNSIRKKVGSLSDSSLNEVITNRGLYRYSDLAYKEQPNAMLKTADRRIAPSAFARMPEIFTEQKPIDGHEYIQILGNSSGERIYRWVRRDYVEEVSNLTKYKVLVPKANGSGAIGEILSTPLIGLPLIGLPLIGFTETYISIGECDSLACAEATLKYVKTKFARIMLGILKVTQNNAKPTWRYVPLQNFTSSSDIDWSQSVAEVDVQLYRKYGLDDKEIAFIESHVKEMD